MENEFENKNFDSSDDNRFKNSINSHKVPSNSKELINKDEAENLRLLADNNLYPQNNENKKRNTNVL